jgi:fumarylpyruvate hydrolase
MSHVIAAPALAAVPVAGAAGATFPVRRIYCVGRNYVEHAKEMGFTGREPPFFFMKPADAVLPIAEGEVGRMPYPSLTKDLHHEVELVVAIGAGGKAIAAADASRHVWGYAVGLDMTRRDLQGEAKKLGRPWEVGKAFESAAPCSEIVPVSAIGHPAQGAVWLKVNGEARQKGDLNQLIWKVPEMIAYLSGLFELRAGDLIFSGTPAGVGPVKRGDVLHGGVDGVGELKVTVG